MKVDDTEPGIIEGLGAGMWTVGVALSGNEMGLALEEVGALATRSAGTAGQGGGEVPGLGGALRHGHGADLPRVLGQIEERLRQGERP